MAKANGKAGNGKNRNAWKGIPSGEHKAVKFIMSFHGPAHDKKWSPQRTWKYIQESRQESAQKAEAEAKKKAAESREQFYRAHRSELHDALNGLATIRDLIYGITENLFGGYMPKEDMLQMAYPSMVKHGEAVERALVAFGVISVDETWFIDERDAKEPAKLRKLVEEEYAKAHGQEVARV